MCGGMLCWQKFLAEGGRWLAREEFVAKTCALALICEALCTVHIMHHAATFKHFACIKHRDTQTQETAPYHSSPGKTQY